MYDYTLIRSARKTLALEIARDGSLIVRAPNRMPQREIDRFLSGRAGWIEEKRRLVLSRRAAVIPTGETIWYRGRQYPILRHDDRAVQFTGDTVFVPRDWGTAQLRAWLKEACKRELPPRVASLAEQTSLRPTAVHITEAKTRWGSCSDKNSVSFSWRLLFCPPEVIDYVVMHELCHIAHKNHSRAFWATVARFDPQYKVHRAWLREHAALMDLFSDG